MAGYCGSGMQELDNVHRLLPRDILEDIGIIDPAERQVLDVVEDLAARLAGVLGGATMATSCQHPQVNAARGLGGRGVLAGGGNVRRVAAPAFLPALAVPWQVMEGLRNKNSMVLRPVAAMPGFAPARPLAGGAQPTTLRRGAGTSVFLPRTEAVRRASKAARSPSNGKHGRFVHLSGQQAAMAIVKTRQEMQAMAAQMEQRHLGVHVRRELALPQEWTY